MSTSRRRHSGSLCCVTGCSNNRKNSPGTSFYVFSVSKYKVEQRKKWISAVNRTKLNDTLWQPSASSLICSQHFIGNRKSDHPNSPSFIPTIFPINNLRERKTEKSLLNSLARFNRYLKRHLTKKDQAHVSKLSTKGNVTTTFYGEGHSEAVYDESASRMDLTICSSDDKMLKYKLEEHEDFQRNATNSLLIFNQDNVYKVNESDNLHIKEESQQPEDEYSASDIQWDTKADMSDFLKDIKEESEITECTVKVEDQETSEKLKNLDNNKEQRNENV